MIKLLFFLLPSVFVIAQNLNLERDFRFVEGKNDTIYLVEDENLVEGEKLVFHSKTELDEYFNQKNRQTTGEIWNHYEISIEEIPNGYISKFPVNYKDYKKYCQQQNLTIPKSEEFESLSYFEKENYLEFLSELWNVPVKEASPTELEQLNLNLNDFYLKINDENLLNKTN